MIKITDQLVCD